MNATRWVTLTEFVKYLGRSGIARVDETEKGWFIAWIDNSPKALAKQEASLKKDRMTRDDEQRERALIAEQIEKARVERDEGGEGSASPPAQEGLKRDDTTEKVVLSFSAKPAATSDTSTASAPMGLKLNSMKPGVNPLKVNPLKRPNVFKSAVPVKSQSPEGVNGNDKKRSAPMSAAERLIIEEQERKRRRMDRDSIA